MANKIIFSIEGNSSKAVGAINKLIGAVKKVDGTLSKTVRSAKRLESSVRKSTTGMSAGLTKVGTTSTQAFNKVRTAGKTAFTSANKSMKVFNTGMKKSLAAVKRLGTALRTRLSGALSAVGAKMSGFGAGLMGRMPGAVRMLSGMNRTFMQMNDVVRLVGQGLTNAGRSLMFFVSLPLAMFLKNLTTAAVDFEDALIRVQKTTGLPDVDWTGAGEDVKQLSENLREMAKNAPTTHVEFAKLAEIIGQSGVTSVNAITNLTKVFEMFGVATDMTAEETAKNVTRIANAFGWNLNAASEDVFRMMNVVNKLENTTAATASEIVSAMSRSAQAASLLGVSAWEVAAFNATLIASGLSAQEAGTGFRNMNIYMVRHADRIVEHMGHLKKYKDVQAVVNAINADAVDVFKDLASAASESDNNVLALLSTMDIFSLRGGKGAAAVANNYKLLVDNLARAKKEWKEATSLAIEYEKALTSTKNQMAMFRNNVNDAAITLGEALLPVINEIMSIAVPAIRHLAKAFKELTPQMKMTVFAAVGLVLIAGPVLMFVSQLIHGVALVGMGLGSLMKVVISAISIFGKLGVAVKFVGGILLSWPMAVLAGIVLVLKVLSKLGVDVAGFFVDLGDKIYNWGSNLAKNLAEGFLAGAVRWVLEAIRWVANLIASFFEAKSPPKKGPLASIGSWGARVMKEYLKGFKTADFGILRDIGRIIERTLTRGVGTEGMPGALGKVASARMMLAKLIDKFNKYGFIDEGLLKKATKGLGAITENVRELVRLQLLYNELQERLAEIEARRKETLAMYKGEIGLIGASNQSIEDKISAIRASQRARDDSLTGLDEEKEQLEEQSDVLKDNIAYQKGMIGALSDQEDLLQRIVDAVNALKDAMSDIGAGGGMDLSGFGEEIKDAIDEAKAATEDLMGWMDRFEDGATKFQGFLDAWAGTARQDFPQLTTEGLMYKTGQDPATMFEGNDLQAGYDTMYDLGLKAAEIRDKFIEIKEGVEAFFVSLGVGWEIARTQVEEWLSGFDPVESLTEAFAGVDLSELPIISQFLEGWNLFDVDFSTTIAAFEDLKTAVIETWDALKELSQDPLVQELSAKVGAGLGALVAGLAFVIGVGLKGSLWAIEAALVGILKFTTFLAEATRWLAEAYVNILHFSQEFPGKIKAAFEGAKAKVATAIRTLIQSIRNKFNEGFRKIWDPIREGLKNLFKRLGIDPEVLLEQFREIKRKVLLILTTLGGMIMTAIQEGIATRLEMVGNIVTAISEFARKVIDLMIEGFTAQLETAKDMGEIVLGLFAAVAEPWIKIGKDLIGYMITGFMAMSEPLRTAISSVWATISGAILSFLVGEDGEGGAVQWGKDVVQGFIDGLLGGIGDTIDAVVEWIDGFLDKILEKLGIESPSKEFADIAAQAIEGFVKGLEDTWGTVITFFETKLEAIKEIILGFVDSFIEVGKAIAEGFLEGIGGLLRSIAGGLPEPFKSWLLNIAAGFEVESPSKVMEALGENVGMGFLIGLNNALTSQPDLVSSTTNTFGAPAFEQSMFGLGGGAGGVNINIEINDPVVRDDEDLDRLAGLLMDKLSEQIDLSTQFGGAPTYN